MSRRRKRNKQLAEEETQPALPEASKDQTAAPTNEEAALGEDTAAPHTSASEVLPSEQLELDTTPKDPELPAGPIDELDIDLPDLFDEGASSPTLNSDFELPTALEKKVLRAHRKVTTLREERSEERLQDPTKRRAQRAPKLDSDELGDLDEEPAVSTRAGEAISDRRDTAATSELTSEVVDHQEPILATPSAAQDQVAPDQDRSPAEDPLIESPAATPQSTGESLEAFSWKSMFLNQIKALSLVERISIALLAAILLVAGIWASSAVAARVPENADSSRLKFPLKGKSVVLATFDSYWRSPIREGENSDDGVSKSIELIPSAVITLDPNSKAKSLRFLFRDETGTYVGDSTTVQTSGGKFLPNDDTTTRINGNQATISATTGFINRGEIISYLSDDNFQWNFVVFESSDGEKFTELASIPISAKRKDF